ncbi:hypothetical protein LCGC14_2879120, partial [marine sediment metagenome]
MSDNNVALEYIDLDLNDVEASDGSFETAHPGEYLFEVTAISGGQSNAGKPKMVITYKIIEAITDSDECQAEIEKEVMQSYSLAKDAKSDFPRRRIKALVEALGVELDKRGGFDPNDMIGARMIGEVKIEQYDDTNPITKMTTQKTSQKIIRERAD